VAGYGATSDGYHMSAPREDGAGVIASVQNACADARIAVTDVTYINTHGTSTPLGDVAECGALYKAFDGKVSNLKINSTKSMTGHCLGAASGVEAIVSIMSLRDQKVHQTLNLENQDPKIVLDCVAKGPESHKIEYAMSNSFGFGGHNSSVIFARA